MGWLAWSAFWDVFDYAHGALEALSERTAQGLRVACRPGVSGALMITVTISYDAYVAALAALRLLPDERSERARQEIRAAALAQVAREIEYAKQPLSMLLQRQGD